MNAMRLIIAAAAAMLVGCAAAPMPGARAPSASDTHSLAMADAVKQTNHMVQHLNEDKSIVYMQNFGGGGVALGLLGPLGVAANISMIESNTKADVAKLAGHVKVDPASLFREAATGSTLILQPAGTNATVKLTPYLLITKVTETTLNPAAALFVEAPGGADGKPWTTKYVFQLPGDYTVDGLAALRDDQAKTLGDEARGAYQKLIAFYLRDSNELMSRESKVIFKSGVVNPRFDYDMAGSLIEKTGNMTWLRTYGGVYALQNGSVTYTIQK